MLIVYTTTLGHTDTLRAPVALDAGARYVCFTDQDDPAPPPYETIRVPRGTMSPYILAKQIKVLGHPELDQADVTVWHDASYQLLQPLEWARVATAPGTVVAFAHPKRTKLEREALQIARYGYISLTEARTLVEGYRQAGYLEDRLTSAGLLARSRTPAFDAAWWREVQRWGYRDQGSLDFVGWQTGTPIVHLPGSPRTNPYAAWRFVGDEGAA